ncbi:hypothetical protein NM962_01295 [Mycobacterium sp. SVM_VP21]|nr:hypothetical protein NM962_01295 [Mycobacterium sp. SVM_VP21]
MANENAVLRYLESEGVTTGEIESFTTESITIRGPFNPGAALALRPGRRVFILDEDTAIEVMPERSEF